MSVGKALSNGGGTNICTPRWFFEEHCKREGIQYDLDICASPSNALAHRYITEEQGCTKGYWLAQRFWCNPPWNNIMPIAEFSVAQIRMQYAHSGTFLVPCRPESKWWRFLTDPAWCSRVEFIYPRLNYYYPDGWKTKQGTHPPAIRNGVSVTSALIYLERMPESIVYTYQHYARPSGPEGER